MATSSFLQVLRPICPQTISWQPFQIENVLFNIHRYFLTRDSVVFRDMLSLPISDDMVTEGLSNDNPILLEGVRSVDFARLLWMFYHP
jgi:hypothetical protein